MVSMEYQRYCTEIAPEKPQERRLELFSKSVSSCCVLISVIDSGTVHKHSSEGLHEGCFAVAGREAVNVQKDQYP